MVDTPEISIGLVGHVDHGKTTLTEMLTGVWTDRHSEELKRGITIRLGYANISFYKCPKCKGHKTYLVEKKCPECKSATEKLRTVSFVDAPGHETLMATMLSGAALMDGAILLIAANEECPQPQTKEHLMALDIVGVKNIIIAQNKIDTVNKEEAIKNYKQIKEFIKGTVAENSPIIPISAQHGANIDLLIEAIETNIKTPERDSSKDPCMLVARSFDINKPGSKIDSLQGGVLGGALTQGQLKAGTDVELGPVGDGKTITTKAVHILWGNKEVDVVTPGGTFGIETLLDPAITKSDSLAGKMITMPGKFPPILDNFDLEVHLLERVVGSEEEVEVKPLQNKETLMLSSGTATTVGTVSRGKKDSYSISLKIPICANRGDRVTLARQFKSRWRLIGYGIIK